MTAVLQVWQADLVDTSVDRGAWNEWYDDEHMAAILAVPGVSFGWRLRREDPAADGVPEYMAVYLLDGCHVLDTAAYDLARRSAGPGMRPELTARMLAAMGRFHRGLYELGGPGPVVSTAPVVTPGSRWLFEHGSAPSADRHEATSEWVRFECSSVTRSSAALRPAAGPKYLTVWPGGARGSGGKRMAYRTVFVGPGARQPAGQDLLL